jgi:hypothetical protein
MHFTPLYRAGGLNKTIPQFAKAISTSFSLSLYILSTRFLYATKYFGASS